MAKMYYEKDCELCLPERQENRHHRLRLPGPRPRPQPEGLRLRCVRRPAGQGSKNWAEAEKAGLTVKTVAEAAQWGDIVMMLINDEVQADVYKKDIAPYLDRGQGPGLRPRLQHPLSSRSCPPPAWTCSWRPPRAPATPSAPPMSTARACPAWWPWSRTPPARPMRSPWPTSPASAAPGPASWRPPSTTRPRPTCSASRPCCAAAWWI